MPGCESMGNASITILIASLRRSISTLDLMLGGHP
nr:MAG TPA: hypothetical protein [Caudoviricetes sp.]